MSLIISNSSIKYGEKSIITVIDLINITITPNDTVLEIIPQGNNFLITVQPTQSTLYYISGYNAFQTLINLSETIYVKTTVIENIVYTNYGNTINLAAYGVSSYSWYPSDYLNDSTGPSVLCTPLKNIIYTIIGIDNFLTTTRTYIEVIVNSGLYFTPEKPSVYSGNLLNLSVNYNYLNNSNNYTYTWKKSLFNGLPPNCVDLKYGNTLQLHPYITEEYTVDAYDNGVLLTSGNITINVLQKPSNIIDTDILPYQYVNLILNRNVKELTKELMNNKKLSQKIIKFYYTTLQTAYRMQWTNKNGIATTVNWNTLYQITNKSDVMILSFEQQWRFFQYINYNQRKNNQTLSNFAFLLSTVNSIYLEHPQKIYIIQQ